MSKKTEAEYVITGNADGLDAAFRSAENSVKKGFAAMRGHFDSFSGVVGKFNAGLLAIGAVLAGGKLFKEGIDETVNFTKEAQALGKQFGITASEASILKTALGDVFVEQETIAAAGNKITQTLVKNEEAFTNLGVKTRGANGEFRATFDIMKDVNKRLLEFKEGTDRNVEGVKIYGKAWAEVAPTLKLTEEVMENARKKASELGLVVGEESVVAVTAYRNAMNDVGDVLSALKKAVGDALLPSLTALAEWFSGMGPTAVNVMRVAMVGLVIVFETLTVIVRTAWEILKAGALQTAQLLKMLAEAGSRTLMFDFSGARQAWSEGWENIKAIGVRAIDNIEATVEASTARVSKAMTRAFVPETEIKRSPSAGSGEASVGQTDKPSRMARWQAELDERKVEYAKQSAEKGKFLEFEKTTELQFWQTRLLVEKTSNEEKLAIRRKIATLELQIERENHAMTLALAQEEISAKASIAQEEVNQRADVIRTRYNLGQISAKQELAQLADLEQEKYAIEREALKNRLKLVENDKIERRRIENDLLILDKQAQTARNRTAQQAAMEQQAHWRAIMQPIANTIAQSVEGMVFGMTSLKRTLFNIGRSILDQFIQAQAQKLTIALSTEAAHTSAAVTGATIRAEAEEAGAKRGVLASIWAGLKMIAINAVKVISAVWSAIAGIPYVGPFLAPVMAIAAGVAVAGLASKITSARGGYSVPKGVNPITQLHEEEMVLPKAEANAVRRMAGEDRRSLSGGKLQIEFVPVSGDHGLVRKSDLVKLIKTAHRQFAFS